MIINAPATKASAFAPVAASISGTGAARQLPATPIATKTIPEIFMMVLLNILFPPERYAELSLSFDYQHVPKDCQHTDRWFLDLDLSCQY
jgi:hypothetical protein